MNTKIKAINEVIEAMRDPLDTIKDMKKMTAYMGAFNELAYGVNPFAQEIAEEVEPPADPEEADVVTRQNHPDQTEHD
jgi:hypothetical protein